jgi:hypothetical protein
MKQDQRTLRAGSAEGFQAVRDLRLDDRCRDYRGQQQQAAADQDRDHGASHRISARGRRDANGSRRAGLSRHVPRADRRSGELMTDDDTERQASRLAGLSHRVASPLEARGLRAYAVRTARPRRRDDAARERDDGRHGKRRQPPGLRCSDMETTVGISTARALRWVNLRGRLGLELLPAPSGEGRSDPEIDVSWQGSCVALIRWAWLCSTSRTGWRTGRLWLDTGQRDRGAPAHHRRNASAPAADR